MARNRKLKKGDKVRYNKQEWVVCEGGHSSPETKSYLYRISRGAWKREVAGCQLTLV